MADTNFTSGTLIRHEWLNDVNNKTYRETLNPMSQVYGAVGDGVTNDNTAVLNVVADAFATGNDIFWPDNDFLITVNIPNFWDVKHSGPGRIKRSGVTWKVTPGRTTTRTVYVSTTGNSTNDGLTSAQPVNTIQTVIDRLNAVGPIKGRQQIVIAAGTYGARVSIPVGLATNDNYLEFIGPSTPGLRGDPSTWAGAIIDGTGFTAEGVTVNPFNNVNFQYILFRDWYDVGLANTAQVISAVHLYEFSKAYFQGCSFQGNGYANIEMQKFAKAVVTGGIVDGGRQGLNNEGGSLSLTASAAGTDNTTIKNALEYGLYTKHHGTTVCDYTEWLDNGKTPAASSYGCAIFAYHGANVDTRANSFKRNNIDYNMRDGGSVARNPGLPDTYGSGVDASTFRWLDSGRGADDIVNYQSLWGRDMCTNPGGGTTTSATAVSCLNTGAFVPAAYITTSEKHIEIQIWGTNAAGGTANVRPTFVSGAGTAYELANLTVAASTNFYVHCFVQFSSSGTVSTTYWDCVNATSGGSASGNTILNPIPFATEDMTFHVYGSTSAAQTLTIRKARCLLWG